MLSTLLSDGRLEAGQPANNASKLRSTETRRFGAGGGHFFELCSRFSALPSGVQLAAKS
jgi:hypothetical protein